MRREIILDRLYSLGLRRILRVAGVDILGTASLNTILYPITSLKRLLSL